MCNLHERSQSCGFGQLDDHQILNPGASISHVPQNDLKIDGIMKSDVKLSHPPPFVYWDYKGHTTLVSPVNTFMER